MKTIGLIGGMSWESSAEYYRLINEASKQRLGGHHTVRSLMLTVDFGEIEALQHDGEWGLLGERMVEAARQLEAGGADCIVLCTNTMHRVAPSIADAARIPLLHIADSTGEAIRRAGFTSVGLLATRFTMEGQFYRERLESKHGLDVLIPAEDDRAMVHRVIYDELCHGIVRAESRHDYQRTIDTFASQGAEAVILGCTEIMLLIDPASSSLPVFDTTRLHAEGAVAWALAESSSRSESGAVYCPPAPAASACALDV
jgi:aspartate racemase